MKNFTLMENLKSWSNQLFFLNMNERMRFFILVILCFLFSPSFSQRSVRQDVLLNDGWSVNMRSTEKKLTQLPDRRKLPKVNIPYNLDAYDGYRRLLHGNKHGDAWFYRDLIIKDPKKGKRYFLFFEGVGSYATVYLNGKEVGKHDGGRTTFTIDITNHIFSGEGKNLLAVLVSHPANIQDLPWVCGGCSEERGFSEGSQPFGIFRPVHLIVTNDLRITPFGIHAWADVGKDNAELFIQTTVKNYADTSKKFEIFHEVFDRNGQLAGLKRGVYTLKSNDSVSFPSYKLGITNLKCWSVESPYLYTIITTIRINDRIIDRVETPFGFRTINWKTPSHQFLLNDKAIFINGIAEYEHLLGQSHAFSNDQIISRMNWLQHAGFNALRDGHQPHNLLYGQLCNERGILWWTQLSAHVWYDTPKFRENFKKLLKEWVIERRNDPSVVLWGLQNESKLPEDFARECTELIQSLDPTASSQRLVTTCNGGSGTDWDVPQNWTGTYGGNPNEYANDIKKQVLIGEYGAWRTIDLHTEGGFKQNGTLSEDRMVQLMEQKIRLAESVKDSCAGQFHWLLTSHDNPGRVQGGEGLRELDRIGPVNYKGLLTPWEEPTDAFYMFRSNYGISKMVYIVSHTWPNRWMMPGLKDSIYVYSNCDEVELFNDIDNVSLGKRKRNGIGTHFQWDRVNIQYNVLYAVGYVNGNAVARDTIVLHHLPASPNFKNLHSETKNITTGEKGYFYMYRINCGGPDYTDENNQYWMEDKYASRSWANDFEGIPENFASQRRTFSPISNTNDEKLFQDFRYGKDRLQYIFPLSNNPACGLPDGAYIVELYFIEPWLGIGGGINAKGMRLFDVAINGTIVLKDLDIWAETGTNKVLKKTVKTSIKGGRMVISFPNSNSGQAIISAIAVASAKGNIPDCFFTDTTIMKRDYEWKSWMDIGQSQYLKANRIHENAKVTSFHSLPSNLYGADWVCFTSPASLPLVKFDLAATATNVFIGVPEKDKKPVSLKDYENTGTTIVTDENGGTKYTVYRRLFPANSHIGIGIEGQWIVAKQPFTNMQPAYDLKPITSYRTNVAIPGVAVVKEQFAGRECAVVKTTGETNIHWPVQTGVADIYSITVKYFYGKEKPVQARVVLYDAGNTMMLDERVNLTFTREGKWNQFTINTGGMINAGNYKVYLVVKDAEGLAVSGIEVQ